MEKKTDISKAGKTDIGKLKSLSVQYRIDKKGNVCFYNPSCDEIPLTLFFKIIGSSDQYRKGLERAQRTGYQNFGI
jgi:hypothetical protein